MRLLLALPLLALLHVPAPAAEYRVERPGVVLVDAAERMRDLRAAGETGRRWCGADQRPALVQPIARLVETEGYGGDNTAEPFSLAVMRLAAAYLATGDRAVAGKLGTQLATWAEAGALLRTRDTDDASTLFAIKRLLLPSIAAYSIVRHELPPERSAVIRDWLGRLVVLVDRDFSEGSVADRNNHRYLRDAVNMAWGALTGDDAAYRKGIERYAEALAEMRPDGSLPLETRRGARATWYMRQSAATLVAMAEIAAAQGHDLYALAPNGRSLHDMVDYLAGAIAKPATILRYASENYIPGPSRNWRVQDLGFLRRRGNHRHYMAWIEPYALRFGDRPAAVALRAASAATTQRPLLDEFSGGNATCFWAPLPSGTAAAPAP